MSYKISKQHQINRPAISVKSKYDNNYSFANEQEEPPAEYNFTDSPEFEEDQDISEDDQEFEEDARFSQTCFVISHSGYSF